MHDMIREMALWIACGKKKPKYLVEARTQLVKLYTKPSRWWSSSKNLRLRGLLLLWFQVRALSCSYDGHCKLIWLLTSGPVGLVEVRAS